MKNALARPGEGRGEGGKSSSYRPGQDDRKNR